MEEIENWQKFGDIERRAIMDSLGGRKHLLPIEMQDIENKDAQLK